MRNVYVVSSSLAVLLVSANLHAGGSLSPEIVCRESPNGGYRVELLSSSTARTKVVKVEDAQGGTVAYESVPLKPLIESGTGIGGFNPHQWFRYQGQSISLRLQERFFGANSWRDGFPWVPTGIGYLNLNGTALPLECAIPSSAGDVDELENASNMKISCQGYASAAYANGVAEDMLLNSHGRAFSVDLPEGEAIYIGSMKGGCGQFGCPSFFDGELKLYSEGDQAFLSYLREDRTVALSPGHQVFRVNRYGQELRLFCDITMM